MKGLSTRISKSAHTKQRANVRRQQRRKNAHDNKQDRQGRRQKGKVFKSGICDVVIASVKIRHAAVRQEKGARYDNKAESADKKGQWNAR
jgi:hypothetical protein